MILTAMAFNLTSHVVWAATEFLGVFSYLTLDFNLREVTMVVKCLGNRRLDRLEVHGFPFNIFLGFIFVFSFLRGDVLGVLVNVWRYVYYIYFLNWSVAKHSSLNCHLAGRRWLASLSWAEWRESGWLRELIITLIHPSWPTEFIRPAQGLHISRIVSSLDIWTDEELHADVSLHQGGSLAAWVFQGACFIFKLDSWFLFQCRSLSLHGYNITALVLDSKGIASVEWILLFVVQAFVPHSSASIFGLIGFLRFYCLALIFFNIRIDPGWALGSSLVLVRQCLFQLFKTIWCQVPPSLGRGLDFHPRTYNRIPHEFIAKYLLFNLMFLKLNLTVLRGIGCPPTRRVVVGPLRQYNSVGINPEFLVIEQVCFDELVVEGRVPPLITAPHSFYIFVHFIIL